MKKALAMALGAVLAAGSAAPASAASQIDISGHYTAHYVNFGNLNYAGGDDQNLNDAFFEHRLRLDLTFQATDEVSVHWRLHAPNGTRWGRQGGNNADFANRFFYGQVVQDWGTVRVGRLADALGDQFGLASLGWSPSLDGYFTAISPFEGAAEHDSIQYSNTWDNGFGLVATYSKVTDGHPGGAWSEADGSDHDADRFQIQGTYQWDTGGVALNTYYLRDATEPPVVRTSDLDQQNAWYINPAFMQSWGAFSVHFEGLFAFGENTYANDLNNRSVDDTDADGTGFYLDFDYNYGPGRVNLAGWWVDGNDIDDQANDDGNRDDHSLAGVFGNFYPLAVAYGPSMPVAGIDSIANRGTASGAVGVANAGASFLGNSNVVLNPTFDNGTLVDIAAIRTAVLGATNYNAITTSVGRKTGAFDDTVNSQANHWALMVSGQHAFTDEITFNYALAYLALVNPNFRTVDGFGYDGTNITGVRYATQDKDLGWEIDLGVNVQLLDNLAFTSTFGYMFTGDAYKQLKGYRLSGDSVTDFTARAEWEDADNAYSWLNSLTFSF